MREVNEFIRLAIKHGDGLVNLREIKGRLADFSHLDEAAPGLCALLGPRLTFPEKRKLIDLLSTRSPPGHDAFLDGQLTVGMVGQFMRNRNVGLLTQIYDRHASCSSDATLLDGYQDRMIRHSKIMKGFPVELAERIVRDAGRYPRQLVNFADTRLSTDESHPSIPLRRTANHQGWFVHDADGDLDV